MTPPRTRLYRKGVLDTEDFPVADVSEYLEEPGTVVWVDFSEPTKEQLDELADELGLHELAVEDALGAHQRPKVDHYDTHLFLACHAVRLDPDSGELTDTEVDAFVARRWLVTVRKDESFDVAQVRNRWDTSTEHAHYGVSFLLYGLLDVVVDAFVETVDAFDDYYEDVSESLFNETPLEPARQRHWFQMRQSLGRFHRLVIPLREAVGTLLRRDLDLVVDDMAPYYQDVFDHIVRASEESEAIRERVATIVDTNLSLRDYRQNLIVKKVTSWAAILAVPTLITSFYGMNVPYPGSGQRSGVIVSVALIVVLSAALYRLFRHNDWL
ncbi:MAG: magnesium transporter CorA family protein [Acidimicrobiia bacterium]